MPMTNSADSGVLENPNRRVKVYVLGIDGQWDDRGTGYVSCELLPEFDSVGFRVLAENQPTKELLITKIFEEEVFQRQGDTIVTWTNPDTREDIALSFQEAGGAQEVWELLCQVQGRSPNDVTDEGDHDPSCGPGAGGPLLHDDAELVRLPAPEMQNLPQLQEMLASVPPHSRDKVIDTVMTGGFMARLFQVFRDSEDLEATENLHRLFRILRSLLMMNEPSLIELCLSDENVDSTMGILEYDPDYPDQPMRYREYLNRKGLFRTAVPVTDPDTLRRIHLNFRLAYLKDVVMARYIDDMCFSTLRELMALNNLDILAHLQSDGRVLGQVCGECSQTEDAERRRNGFLFLREITEMARPLGPANQMGVYRCLCGHGLLRLVQAAIRGPDPVVRGACSETLLCTLSHDPSLVRSYVIKEGGEGLLEQLVGVLVHVQDTGLKAQVGEILRGLLDTGSMEAHADRDEFLATFYASYMVALLPPLTQDTPPAAPPAAAAGEEGGGAAARPGREGAGEGAGEGLVAGSKEWLEVRECAAEAKSQVVEILSLCVMQHGRRMKQFVARYKVVDKVLRLLRQRDKVLALSALRFLRQCISVTDDFYCRYIVEHDLLADVVALLNRHMRRDNLVNSAILELADFMRLRNVKVLVKYFVEQYRHAFESITYVDTFRLLILRYDQNEEFERDMARQAASGPAAPLDGPANAGRRGARRPPRGGGVGGFRPSLEEEDGSESYFDDDDDDEPPPPHASAGGADGGSGGLTRTGGWPGLHADDSGEGRIALPPAPPHKPPPAGGAIRDMRMPNPHPPPAPAPAPAPAADEGGDGDGRAGPGGRAPPEEDADAAAKRARRI